MAETLAEAVVKIRADMRDFDRQLRGVRGKVERRLGGTKRSGMAAAGAIRMMGRAAAAAGLAIGTIETAKGIIKVTSDAEMAHAAFTTLLGSGEKATAMMEKITEFAAKTTFNVPDLVTGGKQLLAYGFAAEEIIPTMRRLGDISAIMGIPIKELIDVYGRARVEGRMFAKDVREFQSRGIDVVSEFAKQLDTDIGGVSEAVSAGQINFENLEAAIRSMTDEGGRFHEGLARGAETLAGKWSNLEDLFIQIGSSMGKSILPILKDMVDRTNTWVEALAKGVGLLPKTKEDLGAEGKPKTFGEKIGKTASRFDFFGIGGAGASIGTRMAANELGTGPTAGADEAIRATAKEFGVTEQYVRGVLSGGTTQGVGNKETQTPEFKARVMRSFHQRRTAQVPGEVQAREEATRRARSQKIFGGQAPIEDLRSPEEQAAARRTRERHADETRKAKMLWTMASMRGMLTAEMGLQAVGGFLGRGANFLQGMGGRLGQFHGGQLQSAELASLEQRRKALEEDKGTQFMFAGIDQLNKDIQMAATGKDPQVEELKQIKKKIEELKIVTETFFKWPKGKPAPAVVAPNKV